MTKAQRICNALRECLQVRQGQELTPEIIEDRARNGAHYILAALEDDGEQTPTGYELNGETAEEHAARVIK